MNLRSKLFATVAAPVLSAAVMVDPVAAATMLRSQQAVSPVSSRMLDAIELAQAAVTCSDGSQAADQASCDAIDAQRAAEQQQAEVAQKAAEQQAAEEAQRAAEQQAADEAQKAAEQQAAEEAQRAAEQQAADEAQKAAEQQAAEEAQKAAEQQAAEEAQKAAEQQAVEEAQKAAEQQAAEEAQKAAEQQAADEAQKAAEQQAAEEAQKAAEQQQTNQPAAEAVTCADGSQAASADACPPATSAEQPAAPVETPAEQTPADQPVPAEETVPAPRPASNEAAPADQAPAVGPAPVEQPAESPLTDDQLKPAQEGMQGETPAVPQDQSTADPAAQPTGEQVVVPAVEAPKDAPVVEVIDERTEEDKAQIAKDPSSTAETVVLPVDNGAAVLDSDKDADNTGGAGTRDARTMLREETPVVAAPVSDVEAQGEAPKFEPQVMEALVEEKGTARDTAPTFEVPTTVINNVTNVTNVTNETNINETNISETNIVNQVNEVRVIEEIDNRTIINIGNLEVVRNNDRSRLRYDEEQTFYEELSRGRVRETIERNDGSRLVTVYNRYGDIVLRSRFTAGGEEYVLFYAPEADREEPHVYVDVGYSLPLMRLTIPVQDYIVTTSDAPDRDYYDFLAQPPVERVERVYSIEEVKSSARIRDKVRRIDLDTITFPSGSAEVPLAQAKTLRKVAAAMEQVLAKDPGETFLIEGHTDAVGSDRSNLILSDQRAETVANLLTEVYGIPPENLSVQGYGERYLKIRTAGDEQQNRRVAIRRVTSLVRPATAAN